MLGNRESPMGRILHYQNNMAAGLKDSTTTELVKDPAMRFRDDVKNQSHRTNGIDLRWNEAVAGAETTSKDRILH